MENLNKNLIGVSGKIGSGKDTAIKIIQLIKSGITDNDEIIKHLNSDISSLYENKKYSFNLKLILSILLGCDVSKMEERDFKDSVTSEEWWYYKSDSFPSKGRLTIKEYDALTDNQKTWFELIKPTIREFTQDFGTECVRYNFNKNCWVNSLFSTFNNKSKWLISDVRFLNESEAILTRKGIILRIDREMVKTSNEWSELTPDVLVLNPDGWNRDSRFKYEWFKELITFDEYKAKRMMSTCKYKFGFDSIHDSINPVKDLIKNQHSSETELDDFDGFAYRIDNNGTLNEFVDKIKLFISKYKI